MKKNTEQAREYFKNCGLTYDNVTLKNFEKLKDMCKEELAVNSPDGFKMNVNGKSYYKRTGDLQAGFNVSGPYFEDREGITFNRDGFIGFAGWASTENTQPFIDAFLDWCDLIKSREVE